MKTKLVLLISITFLLVGCASNSWDTWNSKTNNQQVDLQNKTNYNASMTVVEPVSLNNVSLADAIKIINETPKTEHMPVITIEFEEHPIKDFARNPERESTEMKSTKLSLHEAYVNLDYLVGRMLEQTKDADFYRYGRYYADGKIEILPSKYYDVLRLYSAKLDFSGSTTLADFLTPFTVIYNANGTKPNLYLNIKNPVVKEKILNEQISFPHKSISIYEAITEIKKQLNLNCYLDDDNLGFELK